MRDGIDGLVSSCLEKPWQIDSAHAVASDAMHPTAILEGQGMRVFSKLGQNPFSPEQFDLEIEQLRIIRERSAVKTPFVFGNVHRPGWVAMVLEGLTEIERTPEVWREMGRTLARLHQSTSKRFGFDIRTYLGVFPQDNDWGDDWPTFYAERRLRPMVRLAVDAANMPLDVAELTENLISRLPLVGGPEVVPSLLHGDPHSGNFVPTDQGIYMVDPSCYYGHAEIDLSTVAFFAPVPDDFFDGYREIRDIDSGYAERENLWRVYQWLGHVLLFGSKYLDPLTAAMKPYL